MRVDCPIEQDRDDRANQRIKILYHNNRLGEAANDCNGVGMRISAFVEKPTEAAWQVSGSRWPLVMTGDGWEGEWRVPEQLAPKQT